jgi:hypothetical protein
MLAQAKGHWEVITPSSVDESAPQLSVSGSHLGTTPASTAMQVQTAPAPVETTAAYTAQETTWSASELRNRQARARRAGMPNPQTPWSPNESGSNHYAEDMQAHRQHVASLEQARIAAAASYAPLIAMAEAPPAPETPVASADASAMRPETPAAGTEGPAPRTQTPVANTPVANAEASAEIDRLLRNPDAPQDRNREAVVVVNPALVDTRQSAVSELRVETTGNESTGADASGASAPASSPETSSQIGGTADPAAVASVAGSSTTTSPMGESSASQGATVSAVELPPAPQASSTAAEASPASGQASSGTPAQ